jgi:adenine-specific DNA methylase
LKEAAELLSRHRSTMAIPDDEIPPGDETTRLHRWGYERWSELFSERQLLGLGLLMARIDAVGDRDVRHALATVFSDFLRYQNLLCRYDTNALKCQDVFAVHGFPVALLACENNLLGIPGVGSGSFVHFVEKYARAKEYAQHPYEIGGVPGRKTPILTLGERIETPVADAMSELSKCKAFVTSAPSQRLGLAPRSLDGVFTDPPYFSNVQYAELMDFCYVWLKRLIKDDPHFSADTTRSDEEATGNATQGRGIEEFTQALSDVYCTMSAALRPGAPLVFTYHHNDPLAYAPLVVAILDAGLTCTEVLPVPGEMSASLHIAGTKSSILDSVFVCRQEALGGPHHEPTVSLNVARDVNALRRAPYDPTPGDIACLTAGHVAATAVRELREGWSKSPGLAERLRLSTRAITRIQEMSK